MSEEETTEPGRKFREKFETQKRVLQRAVISALDKGTRDGLVPEDVKLLREGLEVLGWLPEVKR